MPTPSPAAGPSSLPEPESEHLSPATRKTKSRTEEGEKSEEEDEDGGDDYGDGAEDDSGSSGEDGDNAPAAAKRHTGHAHPKPSNTVTSLIDSLDSLLKPKNKASHPSAERLSLTTVLDGYLADADSLLLHAWDDKELYSRLLSCPPADSNPEGSSVGRGAKAGVYPEIALEVLLKIALELRQPSGRSDLQGQEGAPHALRYNVVAPSFLSFLFPLSSSPCWLQDFCVLSFLKIKTWTQHVSSFASSPWLYTQQGRLESLWGLEAGRSDLRF